MAVGDIICEVSALGAALNFQPAAGVEIMISSLAGRDMWFYITETVGALTARLGFVQNGGTGLLASYRVTKTFISNTQIITSDTFVGDSACITGIQIK